MILEHSVYVNAYYVKNEKKYFNLRHFYFRFGQYEEMTLSSKSFIHPYPLIFLLLFLKGSDLKRVPISILEKRIIIRMRKQKSPNAMQILREKFIWNYTKKNFVLKLGLYGSNVAISKQFLDALCWH